MFKQFHLFGTCLVVYTEVVLFQCFAGHHLHPGVHAVTQFIAHQFGVVGRQFAHQLISDGIYRIVCQKDFSFSVFQETCVCNSAFGIVNVFTVCFVHQVQDGDAVVSGDDGYVFSFRVEVAVFGCPHGIVALEDEEGAGVIGIQFAVGGQYGKQVVVSGEGEAVDFIVCLNVFAQFFGLQIPDVQCVAIGCRNEIVVAADGYVFRNEGYFHLAL